MKRDICVAVVEPVGGHGGMDYYDFGLCRGLLAAGCHVSLYTCDETENPAIPGLNFRPFYQRIYGHGNRWLRGLRYVRSTFTALKNAVASGETICHFHFFDDLIAELIVMTMAKLFARSIVITVHDVDSLAGQVPGKRRITGWIYRFADRIVVHNNVSRQELETLGVPPAKISVIPHGNYLNNMHKAPPTAEARHTLGIDTSSRVILFFGQIKDAKGLDLLIRALPVVAREVPEVVLLIAGRPWKTEFARYDTLIDELRVRAKCRLHIGFVPDNEVADYYAAADVVALPYRRIYQSGVILLAMSYGKAVVASDLPGMSEIIEDGNDGYLFLRESKDALAAALIRALQNDKEREEIGKRALEYVTQHHDWNHVGAMTTQLYLSLRLLSEGPLA